MPFRCTSCDFNLPVEMHPVSVNTKTGEVTEKDPEDVIGDGDDLPPCPECGADMEHYTEDDDHDGAD